MLRPYRSALFIGLFLGEAVGLTAAASIIVNSLLDLRGGLFTTLVAISFFLVLGTLHIVPILLVLTYLIIRVLQSRWKETNLLRYSPSNWVNRLLFTGKITVVALFLTAVLLLTVQTIQRVRTGPPGFAIDKSINKSQNRENLILISVDTLRADTLNPQLMPNLASYAQRGLVFTRAFSPSPRTHPSFLSYFSGRFFEELSSGRKLLPAGVETLAEILQKNGYSTQFIGTNINLIPLHGFAQGFDGFLNMSMPYPYHWEYKESYLVNNTILSSTILRSLRPFYESLVGKARDSFNSNYKAEVVVDYSIDWLTRQQKQPFFLWVHLLDPHASYDPPDQFLPPIAEKVSPARLQKIKEIDEIERFSETEKAVLHALYDSEVAYVDQEVGRLFDYLAQNNYFNNSTVVFLSDHGEEFFEHGGLEHADTLYNEVLQVPFIIWLPEQVGREIKKPVNLVDLMPTLLAALEIEHSSSQQQTNLLSDKALSPLFFEGAHDRTIRAWTEWPYKLILNLAEEQGELYNLEKDPQETMDVALAYPTIHDQLKEKIKRQVVINERNNTAFFSDQQQDTETYPVIGY